MAKRDAPDLGGLVTAGAGATSASEIADGIFVSPGISNAYRITTAEGDVQVNAGMAFEGPAIRERFAAVSDGALRVLVFTQSHPDHVGGTAAVTDPQTEIIAQSSYPEVRGYWNRLMEFYARRSRVLWTSVLGAHTEMPASPPDPVPTLLFRDGHAFDLGGRKFELLSTPGGETTDSLVAWMPDERIVFTGNLFGPIFGHLPNLYTIRGDKIRSALRFLDSLERVRALEPDLLVTGHGDPIAGRGEIQKALRRVRDATRWIHDRTVEGMNAGKDVHTLMREVVLPKKLAIGQGHGKTSWCVRAIWEEYAGWFHYRSTTELYPEPASSVWADVVALAGADALVARAKEHVDGGRPVEALHLTDMVLGDAGAHVGALEVRCAALEALLERSGRENFSEVQWLEGRLAEARAALGREGDGT